MKLNESLSTYFEMFTEPYLFSHDNDPVYPVLKGVHNLRKLNPQQRAWHTFLYLVWYHLGSAEKAFSRNPLPSLMCDIEIWPTGTERRGVRGAPGIAKIQKLLQTVVSSNWLERCKSVYENKKFTREARWMFLYKEVQRLPFCGTWAAYKWCDLCKNVLGADITAVDIGVGGQGKNAGPIPGMVQLTGESWVRCASDVGLQIELMEYYIEQGIPFHGLEELETALCDFNSLTHGHYYVGHDIDAQQEHLKGLPQVYWEARAKLIPKNFLGELNGWTGVRKELRRKYIDDGVIFQGGKA